MFQRALDCVVETSGPLHVAFHMLQTVFDIFGLILKSVGQLLKWKKIKYNRVSDSFQAARSLCMILLEELERYLIDVMITIEFSNEEREEFDTHLARDDFPILFSKKYIAFLKTNKWSEDNTARRYCCNFVVMARRFRMYWNAIRLGDKLVQESIFCSWIGIFSLLRKRNYVEIALNTIEQEYGSISYKDLEQLRLNSYVKFNGNKHDNDGREFYCVALDECQEIINSWTKKLPMGTDEKKWVEHSKNLMFARQCINFENREYRKGHIEVNEEEDDSLKYKSKTSKDHTRAVTPRNTYEKVLIYKFIIRLLHNNNTTNRPFTSDTCSDIITDIVSETTTNTENNDQSNDNTLINDSPDCLEDCINQLFDATNNDATTTIDDEDEVIDEITDEGNQLSNVVSHKLALVPIFEEAIKELSSKNVIETRQRRKKRMTRHYKFFLYINDKVTTYVQQTNTSVSKLNVENNSTISSFCIRYNEL